MKGMNATQLITALAVGLIIIGVLAWLVITWVGRGGTHLSESECQAQAFAICSTWSLCDYGPDCEPTNLYGPDGTDGVYHKCSEYFSLGKSYCESVLPF